ERRFPAKPLAEIGPDRETRPQDRPVSWPVAAAAVFEKPRSNVGGRIEIRGESRGHQQRTAEGRTGEELRPGDEDHISAIEIFSQPGAAETHLAGVDHDLDLTGPARRDFVEALIARRPPAELRGIHDLKEHAASACDRS